MASREEQLKGWAQLDFLKVLAALVRKYGDDNEVILLPEDIHGHRGGIERDICPDTGALRFRFRPAKD